ncbi:MAG: SPOR domain-containing protein [Ignavibacterium sp.]|nr:SPOR domain-containing protein [Ignavibacterium sp.]MDW8375359.1 SPOR domain-containing protein [Ignavibacteriales bacterium]
MFISRTKIYFYFFIISTIYIQAQNYDIVPYLIQIEKGKLDSIKQDIENLKLKYSNDPNIIFLDAVTTDNTQEAYGKFKLIIDKYPSSKYADASVYRLINLFIIEGEKDSAEKYLNVLKSKYAESPYIRLAQIQFDSISFSENKTELEVVNSNQTKKDNYKYSIQAGAFIKKENALSLKSQLEKSGIYSEIKEKNVAGTIFNVVYVGKFETKEDAESFLIILNSQFNLEGRVIEFVR